MESDKPTAREMVLIEALFRQCEYIQDGASREGIAQAISEDIAKIGGMPMVWDRLSVMPSAQMVFYAAEKKARELGL